MKLKTNINADTAKNEWLEIKNQSDELKKKLIQFNCNLESNDITDSIFDCIEKLSVIINKKLTFEEVSE